MRLHLGCGSRNFGPEWVHIDGGNFPHVYLHDITKLPFANESCSLIYACHVLEYFDRYEVKEVLHEWKRVLRVGGTLRLAVPDFRKMMELYAVNFPIETFLGPLYGKMGMAGETIYHKTAYDFTSLKNLLEEIGFKNVAKYNWRKTDHAQFDDHSQAYIPHLDKDSGTLISLNIECNR